MAKTISDEECDLDMLSALLDDDSDAEVSSDADGVTEASSTFDGATPARERGSRRDNEEEFEDDNDLATMFLDSEHEEPAFSQDSEDSNRPTVDLETANVETNFNLSNEQPGQFEGPVVKNTLDTVGPKSIKEVNRDVILNHNVFDGVHNENSQEVVKKTDDANTGVVVPREALESHTDEHANIFSKLIQECQTFTISEAETVSSQLNSCNKSMSGALQDSELHVVSLDADKDQKIAHVEGRLNDMEKEVHQLRSLLRQLKSESKHRMGNLLNQNAKTSSKSKRTSSDAEDSSSSRYLASTSCAPNDPKQHRFKNEIKKSSTITKTDTQHSINDESMCYHGDKNLDNVIARTRLSQEAAVKIAAEKKTTKLIDVNEMLFCNSDSQEAKSKCIQHRSVKVPDREDSMIHTGYSDDEYDEYGGGRAEDKPADVTCQTKTRQAHTPSYDTALIQKNKKRTTWKTKQFSNMEKEEASVEIDAYSKLRIMNPLISSTLMKQRMVGRRMVHMSQIRDQMRNGDIEGDWVSIGVIVSKTSTKVASNGNKYLIWRLSDLQGQSLLCKNVVSLFLFGEVHQQLWKTSVGTVVGILNASFMTGKEKSGDLPLKVDDWRKIMVMGQSKDLSWCLGRTKNGDKCTMFVNKSVCEFCPSHMKAAYKSISSKRTELSASYAAPEPKRAMLRDKIMREGFIYGGNHTHQFIPQVGKNSHLKKKDKTTLESLGVKFKNTAIRIRQEAEAEANAALAEKVSTYAFKQLDKEQVDKVQKVVANNQDLGNMLATPSAGSMNLIKHLTTDEELKAKNEGKVKTISPAELLKLTESSIRTTSTKKQLSGLPSVPKLGKDIKPGKMLELDNVEMKLAQPVSAAKLLAMRKAKSDKISIKKSNPNEIKKHLSDKQQEEIRKRVSTACDESERPSTKRSKLDKIDINSEEFKKILNRKSAHQDAVDQIELEEEEKYFNKLEKKEMLENKMATTMEMKSVAYHCKQCKTTCLFKPSDICRADGHTLVQREVFRRFFECKDCKKRVMTITRYPNHACKKCGGSNYIRVGMWKEKEVKLENEKLVLTGEEAEWLDSQLGNRF